MIGYQDLINSKGLVNYGSDDNWQRAYLRIRDCLVFFNSSQLLCVDGQVQGTRKDGRIYTNSVYALYTCHDVIGFKIKQSTSKL